jgi:hypothetical protein
VTTSIHDESSKMHMFHGHWILDGKGMLKITKLDLHAMYGEFIGTVLFLLWVEAVGGIALGG